MVGFPYSLHSDNHNNFKEGFFKRILHKFGIYQTFAEPHSPWQNRSKPAIGEVKAYSRCLMQKTNTQVQLWCFCYEYLADIIYILATGRFDLRGRSPYEVVIHYTPDFWSMYPIHGFNCFGISMIQPRLDDYVVG